MTEIIDISRQTWEMKYHRTGADGAQPEETIEASWRRVAAALAEPEVDPQYLSAQFLSTRLSVSSYSRLGVFWQAPVPSAT